MRLFLSLRLITLTALHPRSHSQEALCGFSLTYPKCRPHHLCALGPSASKIGATRTQAWGSCLTVTVALTVETTPKWVGG